MLEVRQPSARQASAKKA